MEEFGLLEELTQRNLHCTGCAACANSCPVDAIQMKCDRFGFFRPSIDKKKCVNCIKCVNTCPVLNDTLPHNNPRPVCYAVQADDVTRKKSSSGGAFTVLAREILRRRGVIVGAAMDATLTVRHICIQSEEELSTLRKSKYVQSDPQYIYRTVREYLNQGKWVLFSGTPCQVAALYSVLGEEKEQLITVDILCHGVPSQKMLRESLANELEPKKVVSIDFRDKDYGWDCLNMTVVTSDGTKQRISYNESRYEQGFHQYLTLQESCYCCKFSKFPRRGDITIGDFWKISEFSPELDDRKGTSALLINNPKGQTLWEIAKISCELAQQVPISYLKNNRIFLEETRHPARDYFLQLYPQRKFDKAVWDALRGHHDVGIVGNWSYPNYGSELTYYALYRTIVETGRTVVMLSWPKSSKWKPYERAQLFKKDPYPICDVAELVNTRRELRKYNQLSDIFVLGSDQLLNDNLYNWFDKFMQLDWATGNKRKIAYATSFGTDYIWGSDEDRAEMAHFLQEFDFVSSREQSGQTLLKERFGVHSDLVLDPVFLAPSKMYQELADRGDEIVPARQYLFAYILDETQKKAEFLQECATKMNLSLFSVSDAAPKEHRLAQNDVIDVVYNAKLEEWLACIRNCSYMITDSFHGMCMAILFHKPFVAICNESRGATRFVSILNQLGLGNRLVTSENNLGQKTDILQMEIDYKTVEERLSTLRIKSKKWLCNALEVELPPKALSTYDLVDSKLYESERRNTERKKQLDITDEKQWSQLEDHRMRLDGVDDKLRILEEKNLKMEQQIRLLKEQNGTLMNLCEELKKTSFLYRLNTRLKKLE